MGYDVTVQFKKEEEREKMKNFLLANSDILEKMQQSDSYCPVHDNMPRDGENLGYAPKKKYLLGFHGTGIPTYIWDLCAWMAVKADAKDKKNNHFFYYDDEKMIVTFDTSNKNNTIVDSNGIKVVQEEENNGLSKEVLSFLMGTKKLTKQLRKLFLQLNENWNEFNLQNSEVAVKTKKNKP